MIRQVLVICVFQLNVISILSLVNVISVTSFGLDRGNCGTCSLTKQLFGAGNRVLKNSEYKTKTTLNHVVCGRDCSIDEDCKSFNFYERKKLCELNNATRAEHPQDFLEDQGSVYFDADEDTPIYSVADNSLTLFKSCKELLDAGYDKSAVYIIYPDGVNDCMQVFCDMETDGGGWIVFQRRMDGTVDFYRNWTEYQTGFGNLSGEFWLGNDNLVKLTSAGYTNLRVDLKTWAGAEGYQEYSGVHITGSDYEFIYDIKIGGTAGDSLNDNNVNKFTTKDRDNDDNSGNCAVTTHGAWWFRDCTVKSHLNGEYGENPGGKRGIWWFEWIKDGPIKSCSMKLRKPQ